MMPPAASKVLAKTSGPAWSSPAPLTDECIAFARSKGYKKMLLWTNSRLDAARAIYAQRGFKLIKSEPYTGFGQNLVGETWALQL